MKSPRKLNRSVARPAGEPLPHQCHIEPTEISSRVRVPPCYKGRPARVALRAEHSELSRSSLDFNNTISEKDSSLFCSHETRESAPCKKKGLIGGAFNAAIFA